MSFIESAVKPLIDEAYKKGFEAGVNAEILKDKEDQNRRLEDMLHHGKTIGLNEGYTKGYKEGYTVGYNEGVNDTKAKDGVIDMQDLINELTDLAKEEAEAALEAEKEAQQ